MPKTKTKITVKKMSVVWPISENLAHDFMRNGTARRQQILDALTSTVEGGDALSAQECRGLRQLISDFNQLLLDELKKADPRVLANMTTWMRIDKELLYTNPLKLLLKAYPYVSKLPGFPTCKTLAKAILRSLFPRSSHRAYHVCYELSQLLPRSGSTLLKRSVPEKLPPEGTCLSKKHFDLLLVIQRKAEKYLEEYDKEVASLSDERDTWAVVPAKKTQQNGWSQFFGLSTATAEVDTSPVVDPDSTQRVMIRELLGELPSKTIDASDVGYSVERMEREKSDISHLATSLERLINDLISLFRKQPEIFERLSATASNGGAAASDDTRQEAMLKIGRELLCDILDGRVRGEQQKRRRSVDSKCNIAGEGKALLKRALSAPLLP